MQELTAILANLVIRTPVLIVWVVAIALAIRSYGQQRTVALLVIVAASLLLLSELEASLLVVLPIELEKRGYSVRGVGGVFAVLGILSSLVHTVAYGLLVASAFVGRSTSDGPADGAARAPA